MHNTTIKQINLDVTFIAHENQKIALTRNINVNFLWIKILPLSPCGSAFCSLIAIMAFTWRRSHITKIKYICKGTGGGSSQPHTHLTYSSLTVTKYILLKPSESKNGVHIYKSVPFQVLFQDGCHSLVVVEHHLHNHQSSTYSNLFMYFLLPPLYFLSGSWGC